ncbi:endonuclease domain-containing protein [Brevundimonas vitis]|uniref:Endonuclease domain-containing protein n=2 Tax=Brevundimonas vitisensis TaxID=2800818 RepID=A0ABX7BL54_9CAUL|nr:endonuclease domain-containing protein [Brevundimonas vitisensis]
MKPTTRAREMRKALTPPEARLWVGLKGLRRDGYHFRKQAPVRGYFLDFVCFEYRLILEVDGASHRTEQQAEHDRIRDAVFAREGFRTLRFENAAIRDNLHAVLTYIRDVLETSPPGPLTRSSLPMKGRES